ncbi:hypothetical protein KFL_004410030 [Klebsormidium nitens]|uniref:YacP-like NYN domain protein n=1 Tax=Klebsormidium nitens TaxID=105231 RepID=A0A1Y1IC89_KLENI|nr:hypothetical protein KFL_004410030 [Klebsormidium nitens]|eukprot:GAQ88575.1 hypothetical protein KFL_004410030 [Klebsormidium nitens]
MMLAAGPFSGQRVFAPSSVELWHATARGFNVPTRHGLLCNALQDLDNAGFRLQSRYRGLQAGPYLKADLCCISFTGVRQLTDCLHGFGVEGHEERFLHARSKDRLAGVGGVRRQGHAAESFHSSCRRRRGRITCGAKKGAKGGGDEGPKSDTDGRQSTPPRVSTNINIPVRYQLRYVKALKEYQKNASGPPVRQATGYRRKKERPSESSGVASGDVVAPSTSLMGQGVMEELNLEPPVLLVDGYNMCGYWPKLKKHFSKGDLEAARAKLIVELQTYGACKGIKVVVVFDAQKSGLQSHSEGDKYLKVVYSADDTADSWIEREAKNLHDKGNHNVWVVTSDLAQQSMAYGVGATVWSCGLLIQEINQARKEMLKQLEEDRMIGELSSRTPTFEESVSRDSFDKLALLYEQLSRGAPPEDPFGRADVSGASDDDVSREYGSAEDDIAWLSEWAHSDGEDSEIEVEDSENESGEHFHRSQNGRGFGNGVSFDNGGAQSLEPSPAEEIVADRSASGGLAETSGRPNPASGVEGASESVEKSANGKFRPSEAEAIPVAFGKGRVNLGAAVKRRRRSGGEGYSSGSDSEGPPRRAGNGLRSPAQDLEIFQRFDTLPDFGYSTGDEDHRGRMHRRWRDVERAVENGSNGTNGTNGKVTGGGVKSGGLKGTGAGNGRTEGVSGPFMNGAVGSKGGRGKGLTALEDVQNGKATRMQMEEALSSGRRSESAGVTSLKGGTRGADQVEQHLVAEDRSAGRSEGVGLGDDGESDSNEGRSASAGDSLVIRSTTKRVPGQSPRVAKPRVRPAVSSNVDEKAQGLDQPGNGRGESSSRLREAANGWDLLADPETMRSPSLENNGAGNGKQPVTKRVGKGKPGRLAPPQRSASRDNVEFEGNLYRDLESIPFDELTTDQMMALKYGHSSRPGSEEVKRTRKRR